MINSLEKTFHLTKKKKTFDDLEDYMMIPVWDDHVYLIWQGYVNSLNSYFY